MLTHSVKVSWVKRNPKKRCSSVTWAFPKTFNDTALAGFERDLRGHYLIARECKLSLLSVTDGRNGHPEYTILPFRHIEALAVTGTVTLTTRECMSIFCTKDCLFFHNRLATDSLLCETNSCIAQ
jgi:hypothetical protein